jgi:hypothetical protein
MFGNKSLGPAVRRIGFRRDDDSAPNFVRTPESSGFKSFWILRSDVSDQVQYVGPRNPGAPRMDRSATACLVTSHWVPRSDVSAFAGTTTPRRISSFRRTPESSGFNYFPDAAVMINVKASTKTLMNNRPGGQKWQYRKTN